MTAKILDGKGVANDIKIKLKEQVKELSKRRIVPFLNVVLCSQDPASIIYVKKKVEACAEIGVNSKVHRPFGESITAWFNLDPLRNTKSQAEWKLLELIKDLNKDYSCHGILVQLPLPDFINTKAVYDAINPGKDVDVFNPVNVGLLVQGRCRFESCTPGGIIRLVEAHGLSWKHKRVAIINRSDIVGKPLAAMLTNRDATVTLCHDQTLPEDLREITKSSDVVVVAVGKPGFLTKNMVKPGVIVIDVGINRLNDGIVGDVDPEVAEVAGWVSPVPGGVGICTIAVLLENTLKATKNLTSWQE